MDDLFERAATAEDEPIEMNYIKKHALKLASEGVERPAARLFSNPVRTVSSHPPTHPPTHGLQPFSSSPSFSLHTTWLSSTHPPNPQAGDYGSLVNERVGNGDWEDESELGDTWQSRNAFSFGRGEEKGVNRAPVLKELLATTGRIVQEIDSVEYGLTDINEYYR